MIVSLAIYFNAHLTKNSKGLVSFTIQRLMVLNSFLGAGDEMVTYFTAQH